MTARLAAWTGIHRRNCVGSEERHTMWAMYEQTFREIDELAVQRHLMTRAEFDAVMDDPAVRKHTAYDDDRIVGQSVITDDLDAWPLISPRYFARHYPVEYAEKRIFYVGYVCTDPGAPITTFRDLIDDMAREVFACDGIAVMDFCTINVLRGLPAATTRILRRLAPAGQAHPVQLDTQEFWAWRFDGQDWQ